LHGILKAGQSSFLLGGARFHAVDLANLRSSRNFWIYINPRKIWSATVLQGFKQIRGDKFRLDAGLLWHKTVRIKQ